MVVGPPAAELVPREAMPKQGVTIIEPAERGGLDRKAVRHIRGPLRGSHARVVGTALRAPGRRSMGEVPEPA